MSNYTNSLYNDYEKSLQKNKKLYQKYKLTKLRLDIAESENQRKDKIINKYNYEIEEKNKIIKAQNKKIIELVNQLNLTKYERDQYLAKLNINGTNAGIPTSQTPINKKKIIPNSRKNSGGKIGGQPKHKKHKLEKFKNEDINEEQEITLQECPHCHSKDLIELDSEITKDEFDYQIKIIKRRIHFKEYKCKECNKFKRRKSIWK